MNDLKIKKFVIAGMMFLSIVVAASITLIYGKFQGWPWLNSKAIQRVEGYAKEHFEQEMHIEKLDYIFYAKDFLAWVYPNNKPDLKFKVQLYADGDISHNYYVIYWGRQAEKVVTNSFQSISLNTNRVLCLLQSFSGPAFSPPYTIATYVKYSPLFDILPDYSEVKKEFKDDLWIFVDAMSEYSPDTDGERLLMVINELNEKVPFCKLSIEFTNASVEIDGNSIPKDIKALGTLMQNK